MAIIKRKLQKVENSNHEHALLSPSSAKQWLNCPASLVMKKEYPDSSGSAAIKGTAVHTMVEITLRRYMTGQYSEPDDVEYMIGKYITEEGKGKLMGRDKGDKVPKGGVLIDDEMCEWAQGYVNYFVTMVDSARHFEVESRIRLTRVLGTAPFETFGTGDVEAVIDINKDEQMLIIADLKTGRHKIDVAHNSQLMLYACGSYQKLKRIYNIKKVRLIIYQPLAGGASEWECAIEDLLIFQQEAFDAAQKAIDAVNRGKKGLTMDDFEPSEGACQWCRHNTNCVALLTKKPEVKELPQDITVLDDKSLAELYESLPKLSEYIGAVTKAFSTRMYAQGTMPGYKLVAGKPGNRRWTSQEDVELIINQLDAAGDFNPGIMFETKTSMISPTAAEKLLKKSDPEALAALERAVTRPEGGPVIAKDNDGRPTFQKVNDDDLAD